MNNEIKEELQWQSPFRVYLGRPNHYQNVLKTTLTKNKIEDETSDSDQEPTVKERNDFENNRAKIRKSAEQATNRCDKRPIRRELMSDPPITLNKGDNVVVRIKRKRKGVRGTEFSDLLEGVVEETNVEKARYKIKGTWYDLENIACSTKAMMDQKL